MGFQLRVSELLAVEEACKEASIPLVAVQAYGLMGSLRVRAHAGFQGSGQNTEGGGLWVDSMLLPRRTIEITDQYSVSSHGQATWIKETVLAGG